jgi:hypothetical protein
MNRREKAISLSGLLIILLTVLLFFTLTKHRFIITWLGFIFILLAEAVLFSALMIIEFYSKQTSKIIWRNGAGFAAALYSIVSIAISLFYMITLRKPVMPFLALQFTLLIVMIIAIVAFYTTAVSAQNNDDKVLSSVNRLNAIIDKIDFIRKDEKNSEYSKLLDKVYEELRYSDISASVPSDNELESKLSELEIGLLREDEDKSHVVTGIIEEILTAIRKRKIEVRSMKTGGI